MTLGEAGASKAEGGRSGMLAVEACGDFRLGLTALKSSGVFNRLPDGAAIFAEGSGDSRGSYRSDSRQRLPYSGGSLGGRFLTPTFCRSSLRQIAGWEALHPDVSQILAPAELGRRFFDSPLVDRRLVRVDFDQSPIE